MRFILSLSILIFSISLSFATIELSGGIRNDGIVLKTTNGYSFYDVLENKLVFSRKTEEWRFYADLRIYAYYGEMMPVDYSLNLLRAFIRYDSKIGVWTVGKTYVNFGNPGIFNPFEFFKNLNLNDLSYDKEGILAFIYEYNLSDLSGFKLYTGPEGGITNSAIGGSLYGNWQNFDGGIVYNRKGFSTNLVGVYIKGDIEIGINISYAYHFDDYFENRFSEGCAGIDYSFFEGKLFTALTYYYDEKGAEKTNDYKAYGFEDVYFTAKHYLYGNILYTYDEFLSFQLNAFYNLIDFSSVIMPSVKYTLSDGLDLTLLFSFVTGKDGEEFSRDALGEFGVLLRLEAKL